MADSDLSGSQNYRTDFDETWHGWLCPGPHLTWQLWWGYHNVGGLGKWNMRLVKSSFLSFFFCYLHHAPRSHFLTDLDDWSMRQNTCFRSRKCLLGSRQYPTTFRGLNSQKPTQNGRE